MFTLKILQNAITGNNNIPDASRRNLLYLLKSFFIVCTLYISIQIVPFDGSESPWLVFMAKFRDSFADPHGLELLPLAGIFCLYYMLDHRAHAQQDSHHWQLVLLSGLFAFLFVYCRSIQNIGSGAFFYANKYQIFISALCVCGHWVLFDLLLRWALYFFTVAEIKEDPLFSPYRLWFTSFVIISLCWLPWLFASYPATFCPDSLNQMRQFFGLTPWSTHHPPLSTALMGICLSLGAVIKNRTFGIFIYVVLQSLSGAAIFSYLLVTIRQMGCSKKVYIATLLFYAIYPIWCVYAQWFDKDFLYAQFFTLCITLFIKILWSKRCTARQAICACVVLTVTCLLRNNGKFELFPFALLLPFFVKGLYRKRTLISVSLSLVLFFGVTKLVYPSIGIENGSVAEMLSVPFQQTARYVAYVPEEVTDEEKAAIDAILDYDSLASNYDPIISDPVKATYHGDSESLKNYFKVWLSMGIKHPLLYADSFVHQAYGYLAPVYTYGEPSFGYKGDYQEYADLEIFRHAGIFPTLMFEVLWTIAQRLPGIKLLATSGFYSWLVLTCMAIVSVKKKNFALLPLLPGIINILVCLASPMNATIRYILPVIAVTPLLLWWTAMNASRD